MLFFRRAHPATRARCASRVRRARRPERRFGRRGRNAERRFRRRRRHLSSGGRANFCKLASAWAARDASVVFFLPPMFEMKVKWWYITSARFRPRGRTRGVVAKAKANALSSVEERRRARPPRAFRFSFPAPRQAPRACFLSKGRRTLSLHTLSRTLSSAMRMNSPFAACLKYAARGSSSTSTVISSSRGRGCITTDDFGSASMTFLSTV
jgi:hypothetical protein